MNSTLYAVLIAEELLKTRIFLTKKIRNFYGVDKCPKVIFYKKISALQKPYKKFGAKWLFFGVKCKVRQKYKTQ